MFLDFGVDPRAMDTMTLYEIISMQIAHGQRGKGKPMSEEDYVDGIAALRALNLPDMQV